MDHKILLAKSITLLYLESKIRDKIENSTELVRSVLENVQVSEIGVGLNTSRETILALKTTILEMCSNPLDHEYDRHVLIQRVKLNTENDEKLYEAIVHGLDDTLTEEQIKKMIGLIRGSIRHHFREEKIAEVLNKASYAFKYQREKIADTSKFLDDLELELAPLRATAEIKDPAIITEVDIGDDDHMHQLFGQVITTAEGGCVCPTEIPDLNDMLQGGFRVGLSVIGALQHKYKTGFTLSIFSQIAQTSIPRNRDPNKKPLMLRISFEDDMTNNLQFLYQYLRFSETREPVSVRNVSKEEMGSYVKSKLQVNGYHIKMIRVDPSQWTYKSIFNKIMEYEAKGYVVEVLMLDYLHKIPKTGCLQSGPMGADICDLFNRVRNFCCAKDIIGITPHQLSTEAKQLIRNGVPEDQFVNEIAEKGFYEGTKQLDQIVDLEIYIHLFRHNGSWWLAVRRGKHRIPTILDDDAKKYFLLRFPKAMPIPAYRPGDEIGIRKLPSVASNVSEDLFNLVA